MKFSIGDKIILKHTDEEGVVTAFFDDGMVEVRVGRTTFPVHSDELDHPYLKWFTEKKKPQTTKKVVPEQIPVEKQSLKKPRLPKGVYLSFYPEFKMQEMEDVVDYLKIYLINELPKEIQFHYELSLLGETEFKHEGKLHDFAHVYLHTIPFEQMNDSPKITWGVDDLEDPAMAPMSDTLKLKPQKVFQQVQHLLQDNQPSFSYLLFEDFKPIPQITPHTGQQKKETGSERKPLAQISTPADLPKQEVDLHIEQLVDSTRGLSNADIITIQLAELQKYLRLAVNSYQTNMVIIHGLGKGKLRDEVHKILEQTPEVDHYTNEWQGKYGFGATEVWFSY